MKYYLLFISFLVSLFISFVAVASIVRTGGDEDFTEGHEMTHIPAFIQVTGDEDITDVITRLEEQGVIVLRHRGDIILSFIPVENDIVPQDSIPTDTVPTDTIPTDTVPADTIPTDTLAADTMVAHSVARDHFKSKMRSLKGVQRVEYSKPRFNKPTMNKARNFNNANWIAEGYDLPMPFTGKGVVVGVCDIGLDARHPNFLSTDGSECRIRRVVQYKETLGLREEYNTPEEIYTWQTDNRDEWHGTHVTGIAAGGFQESGYYSLAPDADIVFTGSMLSDVGLLAGVEDIIEYAGEVDKPAVINLSMGNYTGPHDGTSLFTQYLDMCADDAIICLSAGNEGYGEQPRSMSFDFTEEQRELRVLPNDWAGVDFTGMTDVWSRDSIPFRFSFYYHHDRKSELNEDAYPSMIFDGDSIRSWRISANPNDIDYDSVFASHYYDGYVEVEGGISPLNGRYYVTMEFHLKTDTYFDGSAWALFWPGIRIEGEEGSHVDIYCGDGSFLRKERDFPAPDNSMNISDLATGKRTISVGMINNTDLVDDAESGSGSAKGDVNPNSSYGTLLDGRKLPTTCAPGAYIISSISSPFIENDPEYLDYIDDFSVYEGDTVYWIGTLGTSMSCPFVVSAIATWLQANPRLTSEDVMEVILNTNITSGFPNEDDPRHGMGWFSAYAGLEEVLSKTTNDVATIDMPEYALRIVGDELIIGNPKGETLNIYVYDPAGMLLKRGEEKETLATFNLSGLQPGVYIVRVMTKYGQSSTLKFRVRN